MSEYYLQPTHAPNVVTERKSHNESQDASKTNPPPFNREEDGVRHRDRLRIYRSSSVIPKTFHEVYTYPVQGIFGHFMDAYTSLRGKLRITYIVGLQKISSYL